MENVAKALDVSPGSVSNHLFSWTCDITPTGLFPGLSFGDNTFYVSPSQNYCGTAVFKMDNQQGPVCPAHGTLFNVIWQPGREWGLGESGYMHVYG